MSSLLCLGSWVQLSGGLCQPLQDDELARPEPRFLIGGRLRICEKELACQVCESFDKFVFIVDLGGEAKSDSDLLCTIQVKKDHVFPSGL